MVSLAGGTLAWALDWVSASGVRARIRLAPLYGGRASSLGANYVVVSQQPAAGTPLTVHQVPVLGARPGPPARCAMPWQDTVVARNARAIVTATRVDVPPTVDDETAVVYRACVRATGAVHILTETRGGKYGGDLLEGIRLAGRYLVAVRDSNAESGPASGLLRYDVITGRGGLLSRFGADAVPDRVSVGTSGLVAWHTTVIGVRQFGLSGVSCANAGFCVAVDHNGGVLTSTDPSGGRAAWTRTALPGQDLRAVSCPTTGLCVIVAGSGLWRSTNPMGGAQTFSPVAIPSSSLNSIACSGSDLCVAVGGNEISSSTNPAGGPSTWVTGRIGASDLIGVSCPSTTLCVAGDDGGSQIFSSTTPSSGYLSWTGVPVDSGGQIATVACPSTTLCVAPDRTSGVVFSSSDPAGPATAWQSSSASNLSFSPALSCPSTNLCVAGGGGLAVTTDPGADPMHWTRTFTQPAVVQSLACPTTQLCVGTDGDGDVTTTTDPAGAAWQVEAVDVPDCALADGCDTETITAAPLHGAARQVGSAGPGPGTEIAHLKVSGQTVSWTEDGQPAAEVVP